jgi:hypothetical protein
MSAAGDHRIWNARGTHNVEHPPCSSTIFASSAPRRPSWPHPSAARARPRHGEKTHPPDPDLTVFFQIGPCTSISINPQPLPLTVFIKTPWKFYKVTRGPSPFTKIVSGSFSFKNKSVFPILINKNQIVNNF